MGLEHLQQALVLRAVGLQRLELERQRAEGAAGRVRQRADLAAADSLLVSISSSRSAPRMPLRAASTLTLRARAAWITAEAVALMTAVTPPDWA